MLEVFHCVPVFSCTLFANCAERVNLSSLCIPAGDTLYISNLQNCVKAHELKERFEKFGTIQECRIVVNPVTKSDNQLLDSLFTIF